MQWLWRAATAPQVSPLFSLAVFSRSVSSEKRGLPACWGVEWDGQKEIMEQQPTPQQLTTKKPSSSPGTRLCVTALSWTHTAEVSGSLTAFWSLLPAFAIKIILRRQPSVFAWLPLLFFFSYFFFFLDESSYQLIPYHQINQTMKSLGLPESKIGPIIHNHSVCIVTDNTALRGWPSKFDGKSPGRRKLLLRLKYLLKFFCVWNVFIWK